MDFTRVINWLGRVVRLDISAFDEIKIDPAGVLGGLAVVLVTNLIIGLGTYLFASIEDFGDTGDVLVRSLIIGSIVQTVVWVAWPGVTYLMLNSFYRATADIKQLIATMGFAYVPAVVSFFIFIQIFDWPFAILGMVAAFVLTQYAIAAASSAGSSQITMANLAGFAAFAILMGAVTEVTSDIDADGYDPPFSNGIWFLDSIAGISADALGAISDFDAGDTPGIDQDALDEARELCEEQVDEGILAEGACDAFD